jgi:hypothetical protein
MLSLRDAAFLVLTCVWYLGTLRAAACCALRGRWGPYLEPLALLGRSEAAAKEARVRLCTHPGARLNVVSKLAVDRDDLCARVAHAQALHVHAACDQKEDEEARPRGERRHARVCAVRLQRSATILWCNDWVPIAPPRAGLALTAAATLRHMKPDTMQALQDPGLGDDFASGPPAVRLGPESKQEKRRQTGTGRGLHEDNGV